MKKTTRIFGILLIAAMLLGALAMTASAAPATRKYDVNGDGGTENAYEIRTAEDLLWFAQQVNGGNKDIHGVLMNDIDMSTVCSPTIGNWTPIGNNTNNFRGYFDGRGFTVKNLYFNDETANYVGLFGYISNPSLVRNVTVTGTLTGNDCVAGIVGRTMGSTSGDPSIINCVNYATVSAGRYAAGILGFGSANVYSSANHGDMSTRVGYAGGIVAFGYDNIVQDCLNTGNISGGNAFGLGHMNQGSCKLSNFLNLGSASSDGVSDKGATNCYSVSKTSVSGATRIDADDVRVTSGELAFLLGGTWGQEIGKDANPVPGGMKVYRNVEPSSICTNIVYTYSNTQGNQTINHDENLGAEAFDNGICKNCGYECTHPNATCTYSNLTDSTHDTTYNCCNKLLTAQPHTFDVAGLCPCGTQAVASVTTAGNVTTYYVDVYAAAAYAAAQDHSTMILLADVDLDTGKGLFEDIRNKVNVTLDLNGKTLSSENSHTINWNIYGHQEAHVTLTINDSVGTGKVINRKFNAVTTSTHLVINGGYFEAGIGKNTQAFAISSNSNGLSYKDTVMINGGTFHSNNGISSSSLSYIVINGGTFTGVTSVIHSAYEGQFVINGGNFPQGITTRVEWSEPIAKLLAHGVFLRDENGAIVTLTETQSKVSGAVTASKGANLETDGAAVTANTAAYPYTNLEHKPTATVVIGGQTLIEGQDYTLSWSNNVNIGTSAVVTATGIGDFSGSAFGTFEITKGTLKVATNPETTYEFGDVATDKAVTGGKVVIVGNESAVIPGTWAWIVPGETAQFTPDAQYIDLFEALTEAMTVTHVVTPATPVIEVVTPSPSIMPGMAIRMSVVVKNPHNGELTDLPTAFRVTYRIGENGTPVTVSGLEFTLPTTGIALGDKVYVTVENVAVSGKYAVATSTNTIELAVGQVDYTKNIDEVKAALQAEIDALEEIIAALEETHGADVTALQERVAALEAAVAALDSTYATDEALNAAVTTLNERIDGLSDEIEALTNVYATIEALNAAKQELQEAINNNETDIEAKVAALTEALEKAQTALENAYKAADATLKSELEALIAATKTELNAAIEKVKSDLQKELADAVAKLNAADKENADALAAAIEELNKAIEAAKKFATDEDAKLKEALEKADAALDAAIKQVQDNLDKAVEDLNAADKENADALAAAIEELNKAIEAAQAAAEAGDAAIRNELASAKASLNASINAVARDLAAAKSSLMSAINSGDAALSKKIEALDAALTAAIAANAAADEATKAELTALIQETNAALQAAIDKVAADLAAAEVALNKAIANGDKALDEKIAALNTALEAAIAASNAADETLTAEMNKAVDALNKAIAQVQKNLDDAKAELVAKDEVMTAELERLNTFVIVVCVIAGTALCGCGVLVYFVFFGKRKLI